jgi:hypothetical protein
MKTIIYQCQKCDSVGSFVQGQGDNATCQCGEPAGNGKVLEVIGGGQGGKPQSKGKPAFEQNNWLRWHSE